MGEIGILRSWESPPPPYIARGIQIVFLNNWPNKTKQKQKTTTTTAEEILWGRLNQKSCID